MIKNVIFDFDGTLADTSGLFVDIALKLAKEFNISLEGYTKDDINISKDLSIGDLFKKFNVSIFKAPFIMKWGKEEYDKLIFNANLFPQIKEMLSELEKRKYIIGILSSNSHKNINMILEKEKIEQVRFIYCSGLRLFPPGLVDKSNVMRKMLKREGLKKEETIYIGDVVKDIDAAKKCAVISGAVGWGLNSRELLEKSQPDHFWSSPQELLTTLV